MPNNNEENTESEYLKESMGIDAHLEKQFETIDKDRLDLLDEELSNTQSDKELYNMMHNVDASASLFKFPLGTKVRNRHMEDGYVNMCGIDMRGVIYRVIHTEGRRQWYTETEIKIVLFDPENKKSESIETSSTIKTDIPQPGGDESTWRSPNGNKATCEFNNK